MRRRTRRSCAGIAAMLAILLASEAQAARLHFGQASYSVAAGGTFQVQVYLDMNEAATGDQMPATGLFSMGVKVTVDPSKAVVESVSDIVIPEAIDTDGLGGLGIREIGSGYARAAGVIPWAATQGYANPLLVTVTMRSLPGVTGSYPLTLGFYRDAPWDNFLDFQGNKLDGQITSFVGSTVTVIAVVEPPRITGFSRSAAEELTIAFVDPNPVVSTYNAEVCWNAAPVGPWIQITSAVITSSGPGSYQAKVNIQGMPRRAFLRITAR